MSVLCWEHSGKGPVPMSLEDVQCLAMQAGFVFPGSEGLPMARQANMQGTHMYF
jgi:hypothetical protein